MSWTTVNGLLDSHLSTFAAAQSPTLAVAWPNRKFTPPDAAYLRPHFLPAGTAADGLGSDAQDLQRGIYQIDVLGLPGKGPGAVLALLDALRAHFKRGLTITSGARTDASVVIESYRPGPEMEEDTRYKRPLSITFRAYMDPA